MRSPAVLVSALPGPP